ncbi:MAG: thioredoxin domain-containing protein [Coleofasciculus sp. G1-WW12-02]|uniref:thioredoxin domain-containing protein n=1 Tax=Coleofasciculus sp. G1-WW12-02 TaxID=3068483 RepID=UPI0032F5FFE8
MKIKNVLLNFCAIACFILTLFSFIYPASALSLRSPSSLTGLVELKHLAKQSVAYSTALKNPKPTLIEFYADWCTTCQAMAPTIKALHDSQSSQINFVMLNIDDPQWSEQIQHYNVRSVPQFTLVSPQGIPQKTLYGKVPKAVLANLLQQL